MPQADLRIPLMNRRVFTKIAGLGALAMQAFPVNAFQFQPGIATSEATRVPLGLCNHALRGMKLKARELIEYAIEHKLDSVQFNTLTTFETLDEDHLVSLHNLASKNHISIYTGAGSICTASSSFRERFGDPQSLLKEGIRVAKTVGSPIVGVRIGNINDRYTNGGIKPKVDEVVGVMRSMRKPALEAGVKFAFENHSGDLRSGELLELIKRTGTDICGAFYDPGNAIYALEDPMVALEVLGEHIICTSVRDVNVWATEEGAIYQWTAIGDGMMDYVHFTKYLGETCPGVPLHVETISNQHRPISYLDPEYWKGFPDLKASDLVDFLTLVQRGRPTVIEKPPAGMDPKEFDIRHQENEFLRSIKFLRDHCGAGKKGNP